MRTPVRCTFLFAATLVASAPVVRGLGIPHVGAVSGPVQPAAEPPVPAADVIWKNVIAAYRAGPIGERVRIGVLKPKGELPAEPRGDPRLPTDPERLALEALLRENAAGMDEQRGALFLRIAPTHPGGAIVRLEMGDLRVFAEPGRLTATRGSVPGGVVLKTFQGAVSVAQLEQLMPPLMLPQLSLALEEGEPQRILPGLSGLTWRSSQRIKEAGKARLVLRGNAVSSRGQHELEFTIDESTFRLVHLRASSPGPQDGPRVVVELFVSPIDPGDVASWRPDTAGRIAVSSLDQLRAAPPTAPVVQATVIKAGDALPPLYLYNAQSESWSTEKSAASRFAGSVAEEAGPFRIAMLAYTPVGNGAADRAAREALSRGRSAMEKGLGAAIASRPAGSAAVTLAAVGLAMVELDRFDAARQNALRDWRGMASDSAVERASTPGMLLCSPAGKAMHARWSAAGGPVIVIVDESLTVRRVLPVLGAGSPADAGTPADLADQVRAALLEGL